MCKIVNDCACVGLCDAILCGQKFFSVIVCLYVFLCKLMIVYLNVHLFTSLGGCIGLCIIDFACAYVFKGARVCELFFRDCVYRRVCVFASL